MRSKNSQSGSEAARIADQLRRAYDGGAWHGPALLELLEDIDAATAAAPPTSSVPTALTLAAPAPAQAVVSGSDSDPESFDSAGLERWWTKYQKAHATR